MPSDHTALAVSSFMAQSGRFGVVVLGRDGRISECFGALAEHVTVGEDGDEAFPFLSGFEEELASIRAGGGEHVHVPNINLTLDDGRLLFTSVFLAPGPESDTATIILQDTTEASQTHRRMMQQRNELDIARRELEQANRELHEARARAEDATQAKSRFLAMMTHEIRTPMNGVLGMLQLIDDGTLDLRKQEFARTARGSAESLLQIIGDILDFSKIEAGRLDVERIAFDLRETVRAVVQLLRPRAEEKGIELETIVMERVPEAVLGDPGRCRQILLNLIGNAIKFTAEGGVTLHVERLEWDGETPSPVWRFEVRDTGIGISEEAQGRLFQEFTQSDSSTTRRFGGTGLGLAISKRLVELMDGRIGVESVEGRGSTFWFELPLEPTLASGIEEVGSSAIAPVGQGARILLVDDTLVNREVGIAMLGEAGYAVTTAEDGAEAVESMASDEYDLILMDLNMPVMDGRTAAATLRASGTTVPIIAMTAHAKSDAGDLSDFDGYVGKPIRLDALLGVVASTLDTSKSAPHTGSVPHSGSGPHSGSEPRSSSSDEAPAPVTETPGLSEHLTSSERFDASVLATFRDDIGEESFVMLVNTYLTETRRRVAGLAAELESGETEGVERYAHDIKSCAGTLGAGPLREAAQSLEFAARDGHRDKLQALVEAVTSSADAVWPEIEAARDVLA